MSIVVDFDWRIDSQRDRDFFTRSVSTMNDERHVLSGFDARFDSEQIKRLTTIEI